MEASHNTVLVAENVDRKRPLILYTMMFFIRRIKFLSVPRQQATAAHAVARAGTAVADPP